MKGKDIYVLFQGTTNWLVGKERGKNITVSDHIESIIAPGYRQRWGMIKFHKIISLLVSERCKTIYRPQAIYIPMRKKRTDKEMIRVSVVGISTPIYINDDSGNTLKVFLII